MVFTLLATWHGRLRALDKLDARFRRITTLRGYNQLGPHGRRSGPLWELADAVDRMASSLELERPDWAWPGRAYLTDWVTRISARRIEHVHILAHTL
jgi:hypothetical protein